MFRELCGDSTLRNVILVTNMWGAVSQDVGEEREEELTTSFFKPVLNGGARLARHHNTIQSAHDIIRSIIRNQPAALQIQRELVDEGKGIIDTAAGEAINKELNEQIRRHQAELKTVKEEMEQVMKERDEETRRELDEETRKLQEHIERTRVDLATMTWRYDEEKRRSEEAIRRVQEQAFQEIGQVRQEMQQAQAANTQQMEKLYKSVEAQTGACAAETRALREHIDQLQSQRGNRDRGQVRGLVLNVAGSAAAAAVLFAL